MTGKARITRRSLVAGAVGQENFFKYLRQEFALDALAEHAVEPDNPTREASNPARAKVDAQRHQAHARLDRLQAEYSDPA